ncbi:hypothetical protein L1987_20880 [Smallanthus sonchifolius]|uniref:Uncharacterized protein n=1 Tax=Smallanthus sonchifolius TaxID=185202 RepID=A0ACB9ISG4_9ASTR|nr:hypothetical protein L1987_20880 [Smallanthus sonchifolius]
MTKVGPSSPLKTLGFVLTIWRSELEFMLFDQLCGLLKVCLLSVLFFALSSVSWLGFEWKKHSSLHRVQSMFSRQKLRIKILF